MQGSREMRQHGAGFFPKEFIAEVDLDDDAGDEPETKLIGGNSIYKMTVGPPVLQDKDQDNASDSV